MGEINYKINESLNLICYGLLAIFNFICIYRSLFKYRVKGLSLYLLIGLQIAVLAVLGEDISTLRMHQIESEDSVPPTVLTRKISVLVYIEVTFYGIQLCFSNTVHWVFTMKYWGVAKKL